MQIVVNGETKDLPGSVTVLGLLEFLGLDPARVAIELDRSIIRPPEWATTPLQEGACLEIVQFVGGG
jgi:thiamine biosynthesis protein ThiS